MIIGYDGSRISVAQRTGTEQYSYLLLKHLVGLEDEHRYRVYTREWIDDPVFKSPKVEQRVISWSRLWTQGGLAWELWRSKPDVLFIPAHTLPVLRPFGIKSVVTIHDLGYEWLPQYHQFPHKLYLNKSTEFAARFATRLIAVSEFTRQDLVTKLKTPVAKIDMVYEGVDLADMQPVGRGKIATVLQKYKIDRPYLLFVGTVQPRKNLVRLVEAFAKSGKADEMDLVIAGGRGWMSDEIYEAPAVFGVEQSVKFLGYIDEEDKAALYSGARATVLVSLFEGFGLPMIESMACQTPVLSANSSSLSEVVGEAGVLVNPESVEDIAAGIIKVTEDEALRRRLVTEGLEQIKKFDWQRAAQETVAVFEKVAGK